MPKKLPDFIIGDAPRSGITWLYRVLDLRPQIYLAKPLQPEPKFFLVDDLYLRGIQYYQETWFVEAPPGKLAGEKFTNYCASARSIDWLIKRLIKVVARVSYHARRWYVHVASAFPLAHQYRAVLAWGP
jgi:hypothetical protein